jgi:hypothetical protein
MSKLYRLSENLIGKNILFLHSSFSGGTSFCHNAIDIISTYPKCVGIIGWYTQDEFSTRKNVELLCYIPPNGSDCNWDYEFTIKHIIPEAKKLGLIPVINGKERISLTIL